MDPEVSQGIGIGLAGGAVGLFLLQLAPMVRDPELRFPVEADDEQSVGDAFVTSVIAFTALGVVLHYTAEVACELVRTGTLSEDTLFD